MGQAACAGCFRGLAASVAKAPSPSGGSTGLPEHPNQLAEEAPLLVVPGPTEVSPSATADYSQVGLQSSTCSALAPPRGESAPSDGPPEEQVGRLREKQVEASGGPADLETPSLPSASTSAPADREVAANCGLTEAEVPALTSPLAAPPANSEVAASLSPAESEVPALNTTLTPSPADTEVTASLSPAESEVPALNTTLTAAPADTEVAPPPAETLPSAPAISPPVREEAAAPPAETLPSALAASPPLREEAAPPPAEALPSVLAASPLLREETPQAAPPMAEALPSVLAASPLLREETPQAAPPLAETLPLAASPPSREEAAWTAPQAAPPPAETLPSAPAASPPLREEDDGEVDLARLCAAFRSLEASQQRSSFVRPAEASTPSCSSTAPPSSGESRGSLASRTSAGSTSSAQPGIENYSFHTTGHSVGGNKAKQQVSTPSGSDPISRVSGSSTPTPSVARGMPIRASMPWGSGLDGAVCATNSAPRCLRTPDDLSGNHTPGSTGSCQPSLVTSTRSGPSPRAQGQAGGNAVFPSIRGDRQKMDKMDAWFQRVIAKGVDGSSSSGPPGDLRPRSGDFASSAVQSATCSRPEVETADPSPTGAGWQPSPTSQACKSETSSPRRPTAQPQLVQDRQASIASMGSMGSTSSLSAFEVEMKLSGDVLGTLCFHLEEDLEEVCRDFVTSHRLRDMFEAPIKTHLELMVYRGQHTGSVDVIDLL